MSIQFDLNFEQFKTRYLAVARRLAQDLLNINTETITKNRLYQKIHLAICTNNSSILLKAARLLAPILCWCWHSRTHDAKSPEDYFVRWQCNQIMSILFYTLLIKEMEKDLVTTRQELKICNMKRDIRYLYFRREYLQRTRNELQDRLRKYRPLLRVRIHRYQNTRGFHDIKTHVQFSNGKQII